MKKTLWLWMAITMCLSACMTDNEKINKAVAEIEAGNVAEGEQMLTEVASGAKPEIASKANLELAKYYASAQKTEPAFQNLTDAADKGNEEAVMILANAYMSGNPDYRIEPDGRSAAPYLQRLVDAGYLSYGADLIELYMFCPDTRNLMRAADMIEREEVPNANFYRSILQYMNPKGSITHNIEHAVKALDFEPTAETAAIMGHILMTKPQHIPAIDIPQVLRYYNQALAESKYVNKEALQQVVDVLQNYYDKLCKNPPNDYPFTFGSPGFHTYGTPGDFNYTGEMAGSYNTVAYPKGIGLGYQKNEYTYCGNWNRNFSGRGVKYEPSGYIYCGNWNNEGMTKGVIFDPDGDVFFIGS